MGMHTNWTTEVKLNSNDSNRIPNKAEKGQRNQITGLKRGYFKKRDLTLFIPRSDGFFSGNDDKT